MIKLLITTAVLFISINQLHANTPEMAIYKEKISVKKSSFLNKKNLKKFEINNNELISLKGFQTKILFKKMAFKPFSFQSESRLIAKSN